MSIIEGGGSRAARLALVEQHVGMENRHDLDGIMDTFGASARYDEEPWDDHHIAAVQCVRITMVCCAPYPTSSSTCIGAMLPRMPCSWKS